MSKQLLEKSLELIDKLEQIKELSFLLPEANDEIQYALSNSSILIYIPYNLHLLAEWQERLNKLGFTRADRFMANEYGISTHYDYDKDSCAMYNKELGLSITLWLCPGHPLASVKKGNIPVRA